MKKFSHLFEGFGTIHVEIKLHIDSNVLPVAQPANWIPFHMRQKVSEALDRFEEQGIIEKVDGPTNSVSPPVVIQKKDGDMRLYVDMRMANKAILSGA